MYPESGGQHTPYDRQPGAHIPFAAAGENSHAAASGDRHADPEHQASDHVRRLIAVGLQERSERRFTALSFWTKLITDSHSRLHALRL